MQVASCSSFFSPPDGSYEGSILELTIEEMLRVEEVAYTEEPEGGKALVFKGNGAQDKSDSLAGTLWTLESQGELYGREIPSPWEGVRMQIADQDLLIPEIELTIEFDYGGELRGNAGCNDFSSRNYSAADKIFDAGTLNVTEKKCDEPVGIMEQEFRFTELLDAAESYNHYGENLILAVRDEARDYVIRPTSEENELVVIRARIDNKETKVAQLEIEAFPAELRMDSGRYASVNTYEVGVSTDQFHADKNEYMPLLRGYNRLEKGTELEGWLIFDVPKGSVAQSLKWEAGGDIIIIDL